jgi:DNA polymerase-1
MIETLRREYKPDYLVAACDCHEPTFRNRLYADYKANRRALPPADYTAQEEGFRAVLAEFFIPVYQMVGYEADDIIGTLAQYIRKDSDVVIAAGDKDMAQLVSMPSDAGDVQFLNTGKNKLLNALGVLDEYGVFPSAVVDYLALVGDSSDNVPGASGIGPNGALMLLNMFGSVEEIIRRSGEISSKRYRHSVQQNTEMILLSKKLVTIDCCVPLRLNERAVEERNPRRLSGLATALTFRKEDK